MLPVKHLASKILMAVNNCGYQLVEVRWRGKGARMLGMIGMRYNLWWSWKGDGVVKMDITGLKILISPIRGQIYSFYTLCCKLYFFLPSLFNLLCICALNCISLVNGYASLQADASFIGRCVTWFWSKPMNGQTCWCSRCQRNTS